MSKITLDQALAFPRDVGIDLETTGLNWITEKPLFLGIACDTMSGYINLQEYQRDTLSSFFKDFVRQHRVVLQNAKFDFHFLDKFIPINTLNDVQFSDTMLISQIIDENASHGLDNMTSLWLGESYLQKKREVDEYVKEHKLKGEHSWSNIPEDILAARGEEDAKNTFTLYQLLRPKLTETKVYELEKKLLLVLLRMERNGALIDRPYLLKLKDEIRAKLTNIADKYPDINLSSSQQKGEYLFNELGIKPVAFTPKTHKPQTTAEALSLIDHPAARDMTEYTTLVHTLSTYVNGFLDRLDENDFLHCNFKQMGARTGRMSCVNPNLQQLPKSGRLGKWIKSAFIGNVTTYDYHQMEAVLYAYENNETDLIAAIERNEDVYGYLAKYLYASDSFTKEQRNLCKTLFLGRIYGMGDAKFIKASAGLNAQASRDFFGNLESMSRKIMNQIGTYGYVETIIGRKRRLSSRDAYKGLNAIIQGSSADIVKTVMVNLPYHLQEKLISQVHDELVFINLEPREKEVIREAMCDFHPYKLQVESGSGPTWWNAFAQKEGIEGDAVAA